MLGGEAPELDQSGLVGMQLQPEPGEPFAQIVKELPSVTLVLEPDHEIIREARDDHITPCVPTSPLLGPAIQDIVEVHVGEQR